MIPVTTQQPDDNSGRGVFAQAMLPDLKDAIGHLGDREPPYTVFVAFRLLEGYMSMRTRQTAVGGPDGVAIYDPPNLDVYEVDARIAALEAITGFLKPR